MSTENNGDQGNPELKAGPEITDTGRLEAFSDGVYAIAGTLLVLDLRVPDEQTIAMSGGLLPALGKMWPNYLAYLISFTFILIMWSNHHHIFVLIRHANRQLLLINGLLLLFTTVLPFPTSLLSRFIGTDAAGAAVFIYSANFLLIAVCYNLLWRYAAYWGDLLDPRFDRQYADAVTRMYNVGLVTYGACVVLAIVPSIGAALSLGLSVGLALFFTLTPSRTFRKAARTTRSASMLE